MAACDISHLTATVEIYQQGLIAQPFVQRGRVSRARA